MIARLLISNDLNRIKEGIKQTLNYLLKGIQTNHPDILYFKHTEKLGIAEAKKIRQHFSLKPFSAPGRGAILEDVSAITIEAQNALLKTIEELPAEDIVILGAPSEAVLLPTILSRCQITYLQNPASPVTPTSGAGYGEDIKQLLQTNTEERFCYIEKLKEKEQFLADLAAYFRQLLYTRKSLLTKSAITKFLKELLQAEQWAKQNVNIRGILEYLMLLMPTTVARI